MQSQLPAPHLQNALPLAGQAEAALSAAPKEEHRLGKLSILAGLCIEREQSTPCRATMHSLHGYRSYTCLPGTGVTLTAVSETCG